MFKALGVLMLNDNRIINTERDSNLNQLQAYRVGQKPNQTEHNSNRLTSGWINCYSASNKCQQRFFHERYFAVLGHFK